MLRNSTSKCVLTFVLLWIVFLMFPIIFRTSIFSDVSFFILYLLLVPLAIFIITKALILKEQSKTIYFWFFGLAFPYLIIVSYLILSISEFRAPQF
jgi:hypothetical protein